MEECIEGRERGKYECRCRVGFARDRRNYCEGNLAKKFGLNSIIDVSSERALSLLTFQRKVFAQNVQYVYRFDIERFYIFMCFQPINALVYNELGYLDDRKSTFITSYLFTNRPNMFFSDIDECTTKVDPCDPIAECQNTEGSYKCLCPKGYSNYGRKCIGQWYSFCI